MMTLSDFKISKQEDGIINIFKAIMAMNTYDLYLLLDDEIDYEDIGKDPFVDKLDEHFNKHRIYGDTEFYLDLDFCKGCNCEKPVCKFIGNHSNLHFALFFEIKENQIVDIYHCNWYGDFGFSNPF